MVVFKDPTALSAIEHHAAYILRHGSKDLGSHTLEGSRPGKAMLVHAGLSIIGRKGYELLIDLGIERARTFAEMIRQHPDFQLTSEPELNILTYRYCPHTVQQALARGTAEECVPHQCPARPGQPAAAERAAGSGQDLRLPDPAAGGRLWRRNSPFCARSWPIR